MKTAAIVLAAGSGTRMKAGKNKLFLTLQGRTILEHTASVFQNCPLVDGIVVVARDTELPQVQQILP